MGVAGRLGLGALRAGAGGAGPSGRLGGLGGATGAWDRLGEAWGRLVGWEGAGGWLDMTKPCYGGQGLGGGDWQGRLSRR